MCANDDIIGLTTSDSKEGFQFSLIHHLQIILNVIGFGEYILKYCLSNSACGLTSFSVSLSISNI